MNYTIYHLHSDYSNATTTMDSVTKIDMYVDKAKKLGMKALAFSEHGNVLEWTKKKRYIEEAGMKYIHAVEPYVTAGLEEKVRDNYHIVLIAKNKAGVREINYLMSDKVASNRDDGHFYYVPRITLDELINTSDNVIITTACLGGILYKGDMDIQRKFLKFAIENKHRVFLEIQHHATSEQIEYNQKLYAISQKTGLRLVAGTDTHSLDERYAKGRLLLQRAKGIRFPSEETLDLTFKSYDELVQAYKEQGTLPMSVILEAIENTNVIADMVEEFELDKSHKYPKLHKNSEEVFYQKIMEGIKTHKIKCDPEIKKRIIHEASVYKKLGVIDYILLEEEIKRFCRESDIPYGPGRGSVTGSYIAYLLQVTQVDSIKNGLIFERFLNPERQTLADVDTDYRRLDRERVKDYLFNREGLYCTNIVTFGRMGDKSGIRDITRALGMTIKETEEILDKLEFDLLGKMIPDSSANERVASEHPEIFGYLDLLKGVILNTGTHAGGVLVSPFPLEDTLSTYIPKAGQRPVAQIDMEEIEGLGFVKLDILGLDNIGAIKMACDLIDIPVPTPNELDTNDKAVWDSIRDSTAMIFQWESDTAQAYYRRLFSEDTLSKIHKDNPEISYLDLFSVGNGAIRPAGASYRENLAKGIFKDNGHEALNKLMSKTNGYCIEENQRVLTTNGYKPIKDIEIGDMVVTSKGVHPVNHKFDNGYKDTIKIDFLGGELIATPDHKILTPEGYKKAGELTVGDKVAQRVGYIDENRSSAVNKSIARITGWLIGDGGLTVGNDITLTNLNKDVLVDFKNEVEKEFSDLTCNIYRRDSRVNKLDIYVARVMYREGQRKRTHEGNKLTRALQELGLKELGGGGVSSREKFVPNSIKYSSKDTLLAFLGAYADTDSTIRSNHNQPILNFKTVSKKLKDDLLEIVRGLGYMTYVYYDNTTDSYNINVNDAKLILSELRAHSIKITKEFTDKELEKTRVANSSFIDTNSIAKYINPHIKSLKKFRAETGILLYRDLSKGEGKHICSESLLRMDEKYKKLLPEPMVNENLVWGEVQNISPNGCAKVYDLEVDTDHSYVAEGIVVSNCIYQEQIIDFLHRFCGFSLGEADIVRRAFTGGGDTSQFTPKIEAGFVKTMEEKYDTDRQTALEILDSFMKVIIDASNYLFSENHSVAYSYIGYTCAWLRYYYPLEFITASFEMFKGKDEKTAEIYRYMRDYTDIKMKPIQFRYSRSQYNMDKVSNAIYKGMNSVKYLNEQISEELYELRDKEYEDFIDLLVDVRENTSCNSRQIKILISLDYFKEFGGMNYLLNVFDEFENGKSKYKKTYVDKTKVKRIEALKTMLSEIKAPPTTIIDIIINEKEYLGYVEFRDESISKDVAVVLDGNLNRYGAGFFTLYHPHDTKTIKVKVRAGRLSQNPITQYDVIQVTSFKEELKRGSKTETENILYEYKTVNI